MTTVALLIAMATAALVLWLGFELLRLRRRVDLVPQDGGVFEALRELDEDLSKLEVAMADLGPRVELLEQLIPHAIQHTAVVSYDAYGNVAGSLSRSIALLDAGGSGMVVSLLVGREQTRWYTKEVNRGTGSESLSPEEQQAVANAMSGTMRAWIDPTLLRSNTDVLRKALGRRGLEVDLGELIDLDDKRRKARSAAEELRAEQKKAGKAISSLEGKAKQQAIEAAGKLSEQYKAELGEADRLDALFHEQWLPLPNIADESVPDGAGEEDNLEIKRWGEPTEFDFAIRDHLDLGEALGVIDVERAAKASGARFNYLKGRLALMEFALVRWAMERLSAEGFTPVVPPVLVREAALVGTGFFPGDRDQVYEIEADDLFLAGTAEIPLAAMHLDEIFDSADLPRRYVGFSTCFRREAGTYGRDTRGILRQHQFDKVEMFSFSRPEDSPQEHEFLLAREEALVQELGLPYRVVNVCIGDLGAPAAKKYDIEVWLPGEQAYRELTSCSNTTDFQARRLKIRHKGDGPASLVHTLNGTATAIGRTLIAIMENYQQEDGTVRVPEALVPYAGFEAITAA